MNKCNNKILIKIHYFCYVNKTHNFDFLFQINNQINFLKELILFQDLLKIHCNLSCLLKIYLFQEQPLRTLINCGI